MKKDPKATILIVDDKEANIMALEQLLLSDDRTVLKANSGKEALTMSLNKDVDLIILDVKMPEMDGFEVANILRSNKRTGDIPIIFASAEKKEHQFMIKGYEEGAIDYLYKPLNPEIVKAKVAVFLKLQLQKKELLAKNKSLERRDLLINNSADIIGILDGTTLCVEEINQAFTVITGYTLDEIMGRSIDLILQEEDVDYVKEFVHTDKNELLFETQICCKDGALKWLEWKVVIKDKKWFINARDITEQKKANDDIQKLNEDLNESVLQLEASNRELESFSYSVSHDLRAPLRALNGYSTMLEEDYADILDEEGKRKLLNIRTNAKKMGTLINDLLEFSKAGRKELRKAPVNMSELVESLLAEIARNTEHKATVKLHPLLPADCDMSLILQVWMNLVSNAIKYSGKQESPVVEIGCQEKGKEIIYFVKDNGAGFDMQYADKLFGVFQRLHSDKEFEGTGVGLAIVNSIVTRHGGKVWAEGVRDQGATFYFSLAKPKH